MTVDRAALRAGANVAPGAAELFATFDWSNSELGPVDSWPRSLLGYVSMVLEMPWPAIIFWGEHQIQIYNDGYAVIMGPRHPRYFGARYRDCWPDTYPTIYPWMRKVLDRGEVVEVRETHIPLTRFGFDEEAYFTFTFSPLRDDDGRIRGILQPVFEVSSDVLSTRRALFLRTLSAVGRADSPMPQMAAALGSDAADVPFALVWLRDAAGGLALAAGARQHALDPAFIARLEAAAGDAFTSAASVVLDGPGEAVTVPDAPPARQAMLMPLEGDAGGPVRGVVAFGVSARLHLDDRYRQFLEQAAGQVALSLRQASALQALERHRTYLNELFLQAPAGIAILQGPDHVYELVNPIYRALIGQRDVVGQPIRQALPELADQPFLGTLDQVYASGTPFVGREVSALLDTSGNGERHEAMFTFVFQPLRDEGRVVTGILVMCFEVTVQVRERRRAEALANELRQEHQRKDDFLAMLAHELRNPLAPISSAAEVLRRGGLDPARHQWASQIITRQVSHMVGLIDDLLDVARVNRGLVRIERGEVDLKDVVAEAVEQVRPLVEARRHRLTLHLPAESAFTVGDRNRLLQVVANLLTNAAKYTPDGGALEVALGVDADQVRIDVRDDGIGIADELLPRVFDLFVQAKRSDDRAQGGLGIGLALVKMLVELHGGTVDAKSGGSGQGSVFTVRLPHAAAASGATCPDRTEPGVPAPARSVLVVDDNVDAAQTLALQLETLGHAVRVEHDPFKALESARRDPPDLCILDIGLPGMDGNELARRLRSLPQTAGTALVAVTGYGQDADRRKAMDAGFDRYFVKPIDAVVLAQLVGR